MKSNHIISILLAGLSFGTALASKDSLSVSTSSSSEPEKKPYQIGFITPISNHGEQAPEYVNEISLNIFAGYSSGTDGLEIGGFANANRLYTKGIQLAGFSNATGGYVQGVQAAGFGNVVKGTVEGVQIGGFGNISNDDVDGIQLGGFGNVLNGSLKGFQGAGFSNLINGDVEGIQLAGFSNISNGSVEGFQGAGFVNMITGSVSGGQVSGFANFAKGDVDGVQAAGFINTAEKVKGIQVGFINVADSVDGVSIGFFSHVKNGLREVEISGNEVFYFNPSYRTGTEKFYTIFSVGAAGSENGLRWGFGYGAGSQLNLNKKSMLNLELSSHHVNDQEEWNNKLSLLTKLDATYGLKLGNKATLIAGPSFNVLVYDMQHDEGTLHGEDFLPYTLYQSETNKDYEVSLWIGGKVGIRF